MLLFFLLLIFIIGNNTVIPQAAPQEFTYPLESLVEHSKLLPLAIQQTMSTATPEQWQLLATITLLSLSRAQASLSLEKKLDEMILTLWHIATMHHQQEPLDPKVLTQFHESSTTLSTFIADTKDIVQAHNYSMRSLETADNESVRQVITAMINDTSIYIQNTCSLNTTYIDTTLKNVAETVSSLHTTNEQLYKVTTDLLKAASFADQKKRPEIAKVEFSESLVIAMHKQAETLYKNGLALNALIHSTQEAGIFMFYAYYKAIYTLMKDNKIDDSYFALMFNANGHIDKAHQNNAFPLPKA